MLRRSVVVMGGAPIFNSASVHYNYFYNKKFPNMVSFHKMPWKTIKPGDTSYHTVIAEHLEQTLKVASHIRTPNLFAAEHIDVPEEQWLSLLPNTMYILQQVEPIAKLPDDLEEETLPEEQLSWAPLGWIGRRLPHHIHVQAYGGLASRIGDVDAIHHFTSPDLRLCCSALTISKLYNKPDDRSSLAPFYKEKQPFTFFHFYRPNRSPSEITRPFEKYYVHYADLSVLNSIVSDSSWTPVLEQPKAAHAKQSVAKMPFKTPTTYALGLNDHLGIIPGSCFGTRNNQWGTVW